MRTVLCPAVAFAISLGMTPMSLEPAQAPQASPAWPQWGGPNRDFVVDSRGLANAWPPAGPKKLWSRALGEGHSAIALDGGRLYTMYRPLGMLSMVKRSEEEIVTAMDATTGKTLWEHKYASPTSGVDYSQGAGPHSTPLVTGDRVYAAGSRKELMALDKADGALVWSHDLIKEYGATPPDRGYSCSPLLYGGNIIVSVGGPHQALAAFNAETGALVWKKGDFEHSPNSPLVIDVDGQKQILFFAGDVVAAVNPTTGDTLWTYPHKTDWGLNISTPVWSPADHLLFVSAAYSSGSRVLELHQSAGKTTVTQKWFNNRMRIHIGTAIRIGGTIYGSSGDFGPAFLTAVDVTSGKILWQDRTFARAQLLYADRKLVLLDEDGTLGLATPGPDGLKVLAKASVLQNLAWTPPTLVGTHLFARDRKTIAAYDLGS